jgi:GNAT superfamily N-acetyltransferase
LRRAAYELVKKRIWTRPVGDTRLPHVLREAAEYPNSFIRLGPGVERVETPRFALCMERIASSNTVQRQRFAADQLDEVLSEVRSLLRARGRTRTQWEIGSAAEPLGLVELLLERGLVRDTEPFGVALVLDEEPPPAPPGAEARQVRTFEEFAAAAEVQWEAFGMPAAEISERRAELAEQWESSPMITHAVWIDGRVVGAGRCGATPYGLALFGGATLPDARGRGAYRALIRARWEYARASGAPALLTQAGAMSRPILERLGFRQIGHIHMLVDDFGQAST